MILGASKEAVLTRQGGKCRNASKTVLADIFRGSAGHRVGSRLKRGLQGCFRSFKRLSLTGAGLLFNFQALKWFQNPTDYRPVQTQSFKIIAIIMNELTLFGVTLM